MDARALLEQRFVAQRKVFADNPYLALEERLATLTSLRVACALAAERLPAALAADFGRGITSCRGAKSTGRCRWVRHFVSLPPFTVASDTELSHMETS